MFIRFWLTVSQTRRFHVFFTRVAVRPTAFPDPPTHFDNMINPDNSSALVTGGTGFVGGYLVKLIPGCFVTTRNASAAAGKLPDGIRPIGWDPLKEPLPTEQLSENPPRTVFNLMGESVASGRWTAARKKRIRESRVQGTSNLIAGIRKLPQMPETLISASAVGYYGDGNNEVLDESAERGTGFLADVCEEWESAAKDLTKDGVRVVHVRIGLVIGTNGGALQKLLPIFKWGLGGRLGSGKQWMPWVHVRDLVRLMVWAADNRQAVGVINGTAPDPVTNSEFTRELAKAVNRPAILPVPGFALRLALGEFANSLLVSQRVVPERAKSLGFEFEFPTLAMAIEEAVK
jgi:uncharacterized protein (TIGR01777 family)